MVIQEYGTEHKETILLLHGGGLSWWNFRDAAELRHCLDSIHSIRLDSAFFSSKEAHG